MKDLYVVSCCRTAVGSFGGSLKDTPATDLGAIVVKEALARANVKPEQVDEVMFGCILTAAQGQNPARQVAIKAGVPFSVPAYTVGMVCGSGMKSVIEAGRAIRSGDAEIVVCGGTENMSAAPFASMDARWGARMGDKKLVDTMIKDGLWDAYNNYHMGTTAENICDIWGITREELDAFAASSQQKTEAAQKAGKFEDEIVPVTIKKKKEMVEFKVDEFPKAGVTAEGIAKLRGAFPVGPEGVEDEVVHTFELTQVHEADTKKHVQRVTAANASGINDGAAAIVLASGEAVEKYGLKPMAKLVSWGHGGVDPKIMGVGPVPASRQAMAKPGGGQRGVRRPVHRRGPGAGLRHEQGQRQRRRHLHRPPRGRLRRAHHRHPAPRDGQAARGQEGPGHPVHRRRHGRCHHLREVLKIGV